MAVATLPRQSWSVQAALRALDALLASWRYVASPIGRDPRLDLLRGFCVFAMIVDHIGGTSWLYAITGGNRGPVTAAEGFVFLSGLVLGIVSRRRLERDGLRAAARAALRRAWTLYALCVALTGIFVAVTVTTDLALWVDRALLGDTAGWTASEWAELAVSIVLLRFTWHGTDILALYAVLLAAAPLALFLLAEGRAWTLLGGSSALWLAYQLAPERAAVPWPIEHAAMFPVAAWQVLFVTALVLGYHRAEIGAWLAQESSRPRGSGMGLRLGLGTAAVALLLVIWAVSAGEALALGGEAGRLAAFDPFDKAGLGIGRLVAFAGLASLVYGLLTLCWRPIERGVGWLLIPLGQASLYAYTVHLFLILVAYNVPPYVGSDQPGWELHNTVGQLLLVLAIWALVKRQVLFRMIPR